MRITAPPVAGADGEELGVDGPRAAALMAWKTRQWEDEGKPSREEASNACPGCLGNDKPSSSVQIKHGMRRSDWRLHCGRSGSPYLRRGWAWPMGSRKPLEGAQLGCASGRLMGQGV